jgi:hydroxymethylbilane synthase
VGKGFIAIFSREDVAATRARLAAIYDRAASLALEAERAFLDVLDGSCRTPIGGHARIAGDELFFHGIIVKPDGSSCFEVERMGAAAGARLIGADAAADLVRRGGAGFFSD